MKVFIYVSFEANAANDVEEKIGGYMKALGFERSGGGQCFDIRDMEFMGTMICDQRQLEAHQTVIMQLTGVDIVATQEVWTDGDDSEEVEEHTLIAD